jgi:hypothetical protein
MVTCVKFTFADWRALGIGEGGVTPTVTAEITVLKSAS